MTNIKDVLLTHFARYPKSTVQDLCKLLYQNEFGPGHLVRDMETCISRIRAEREQTTKTPGTGFEPIGNGRCRLHLSAEDTASIPDEVIARIFAASASFASGTVEGFRTKAAVLRSLCANGQLPFSTGDVDTFLSQWEAAGHPLFSHSDIYKAAYAPAYRVIDERYIPLLPLICAIFDKMRHGRTVVAIDGRCGSGKTTLASLLAPLWDSVTIHMDDFFLPPSLRTPERLSEAGGNIHYERFADEVLSGLSLGHPFSYGVFDCSQMAVTGKAQVGDVPLVIVEGSYSLHPKFGDYADVTVFCDIDPALQRERIIKRNGEAMYRNFETRWIPMEETYFDTFGIRNRCDFCIKA